MSIKELITRLVRKQVSFGRYTGNEVALPWTSPQDGFLKVYLNPANSNDAYLIINGDSGEDIVRLNSTKGMAEYAVYPVTKGTNYVYSAGGNIGAYRLYFKPICKWGGRKSPIFKAFSHLCKEVAV